MVQRQMLVLSLLQITDNGNIILSNNIRVNKFPFDSSSSSSFPASEQIIAAMWADVDGTALTRDSNVFYQVLYTERCYCLAILENILKVRAHHSREK